MDGIIAVLLTVVFFWGVFGLVMRPFQDLPVGYNTLPPGPEYEEKRRDHRPAAPVRSVLATTVAYCSTMFGVAVVLIIVK